MSVLLSLFSKFIASLLVLAIFLAAIALLLSQTLLSSHYIEGQLAATNSYNRLSGALVNEVAQQANLPAPAIPVVKDKLRTVLTPAVLQQKLALGLAQLQMYYQGKGPAPSIPMDDLKATAIAAGVPIGDDSDNPLSKPITLTSNNQVRGVGKKINQAKTDGVLAAVLLVALLLLVSWKRHRWAALPDVLMNVGVLLGLVALVFGIGPGLAEHYIKFNLGSNAFAGIGHDLAVAISHDLAKRLGITAICCFVIGLGTRIWLSRRNRSKIKQVTPLKKKIA